MTAKLSAPSLLSAFALVAAIGCGGASESESTETISAEAGGTLILNGSTLLIPGNALAEDTVISMRMDAMENHAALPNGYDEVLTIEPAAIPLSIPATLTLRLGGEAEQGAGATAYYFTDGVWIPMDANVVSGGGLEVTVSRLGSFAVTSAVDAGGGNQIVGLMTWSTGDPVAQAPVDLLQGGVALTQTFTNSDGSYAFVDLSPGEYTVSVTYECNFETAATVRADAATSVDIILCQ